MIDAEDAGWGQNRGQGDQVQGMDVEFFQVGLIKHQSLAHAEGG